MFEEGADEPGGWADAIVIDATQRDFKNRINRARIGLLAQGHSWSCSVWRIYYMKHIS